MLTGCSNLDENVYSDIDMNNFFKTESELVANAGRAYTKLQAYNQEQSLWTLLIQTSDECAVPAHGGSWYSNRRYQELQTNKIPAANKLVKKGWNFLFNGIAACNEIIYETQLSSVEIPGKDKLISEMKVLRAFFYYEAMANWGNVPFSIDYTDTSYPVQKDRKFIYDFILTEINDNIGNLDAKPTSGNYGRLTQDAARCLLAKMYLNAATWFGQSSAAYDKAEQVCLQIINGHNYSIENDYSTNFAINNEVSKENIFVIPYDNVYTSSWDTGLITYVLTLDGKSSKYYNIGDAWDGFICEPDFYQKYASNDTRKDQSWLIGGEKYGFTYKPVFDESKYYNSNGGRADDEGARCIKWPYQTDGTLTGGDASQNNDFAIFRYADVVLMYEEALLRQKKSPVIIDALTKIRTRANQEPYTTSTLTLEELYNERGRELAWEGWRHEDMIRFGTYLKQYWAHPDQSSETFRNLFPIPADVLNSNPNLVPNPGY
jgi:SusD family.